MISADVNKSNNNKNKRSGGSILQIYKVPSKLEI